MDPVLSQIAFNLGAAWLAGSLIGFERSFHGRAAGFRTHALVALASAAVMVIVVRGGTIGGLFASRVTHLDPTPQVVQGVMTGVGFLGAGVIFKEGVSVQGLTTAACIWCTAAIGLLFGLDLTLSGIMATAAVLTTLIVFRWVEKLMPGHTYAQAVFRFEAALAPTEPGLRIMLDEHEVNFIDASYRRTNGGEVLEFSGMLMTKQRAALPALAARLRDMPGLVEFDVSRLSK
jgi:putative Mg2+ transporter-C (MgtC) family protein